MTEVWGLPPGELTARAQELFDEQVSSVYRRRDRIFAWLMAAQWVFGVVIALLYSPYGWAGRDQSTHIHVYYAVFVGGAISGVAIALAVRRPGWVVTRHTVAAAQVLWSALLIHLTGGRIETHFHIFGSLAFLAFYRDWRVLITATLVVAFDHLVRGATWPNSVYGEANPEWWRFLEHALWLTFETAVLVISVLENVREMKMLATRQAEMENFSETIERKVWQRTEELEASREQYRALVETTRSIPWRWHLVERRFEYVGPQAATLLGCTADAWLQPGFLHARLHPDDQQKVAQHWQALLQGPQAPHSGDIEYRIMRDDGSYATVRNIVSTELHGHCVHGFMLDITEQRRIEMELLQAQKLESVGRLAAGIAHEINTPIQFVSDSMHFVRDSFTATLPLIGQYQRLRSQVAKGEQSTALLEQIERAERDGDLTYLLENTPGAIDRALEGMGRVATLVRSMKEFAHPDQKEKAPADLNRALATTLTIARSEYKYVADIKTDFGELPTVRCHVSELNQVFLNIIVNASHAIEDVVKATGQRGTISVQTRSEGDHVVIRIADTGGGIPENIRAKVFEPFFTTKEVGKGTGQGLSIARNVVVDKHGGTLSFETEQGAGTTFVIRLPTGELATKAPAAAA